jgi:hypothetical protein
MSSKDIARTFALSLGRRLRQPFSMYQNTEAFEVFDLNRFPNDLREALLAAPSADRSDVLDRYRLRSAQFRIHDELIGREERTDLVLDFLRSDLTRVEFARQRGISASRFLWWINHLEITYMVSSFRQKDADPTQMRGRFYVEEI